MINLPADKILAIPSDAPEYIFSNNKDVAKKEFHQLGKIWHPDPITDPVKKEKYTRVFAHISELYNLAKATIGTPQWKGHNILVLKTGTKTREIYYTKQRPFELGEMYIGHTEVLFALETQYQDLFNNAKRFLGKFKYSSDRMEKEASRYLPQNVEYYSSADRLFILAPKTKDVVLLDDVVRHFGNKLEPRQVGWIQSTIHNVSCYLSYAGIVHGDISTNSYFISPEHHSGVLLGGWWYATRKGDTIKALPGRSVNLCPPSIMRKKQADYALDLELIRATGRELLGDLSGVQLNKDSSLPRSLVSWLNGTTSGNAVEDYKRWRTVLEESFGKPKFVKMEVDADTLYGIHK